jgi:hypothetical protein
MDDDSGRTAARMDYIFREIGRRLRLAAASRAAATCETRRNAWPRPVDEV